MAQKGSPTTLPPCEICNTEVAIYRCPRCYIRTCSLLCCREHKTKEKDESSGELICNGKRDRTKFCSLKGFTDAQLASDYHFLEDVMSSATSSKRLYQSIVAGHSTGVPDTKRVKANSFSPKRTGMAELSTISSSEPVHPLLQAGRERNLANRLSEVDFEEDARFEKQHNFQKNNVINRFLGNKQKAATALGAKEENIDHLTRQADLGGIYLLRMPQGMGRRTANTTKFSKKNGLTWKVEFNFHCPSDINDSEPPKFFMVESEVNESSTWLEALGKHLDVYPGNAAIRSQLKMFANERREALVLLMKRLPFSSAKPQYLQFNPNTTLKDSLRGKTIIEYPTVEVIFETDRGRFPLFIGVVV